MAKAKTVKKGKKLGSVKPLVRFAAGPSTK
jgi:hypothetical protein